jgi:hypothetical protein
MKRTILVAGLCAALFTLGLAGCDMFREGNVYIQLGWAYTPDTMYSTDPSLQGAYYIAPFTNYETEPGTYYLTYHHAETGLTHYIYYTLTAHEGRHAFEQGPDAVFQVYCWENANPPQVFQLRSAAAPAVGTAKSVTVSTTAPAAGKEVPQFEYTQSVGGWDLAVRGGLLE